jgi:hypothetical protein
MSKEQPQASPKRFEEVMATQAAKARDSEVWEAWSKIFTVNHDKAVAYTRTLTTVGYAGFFTIWGLMRSYLTDLEMIASAYSMGISLFVFISWEVWTTIRTGHGLARLSKDLKTVDGAAERMQEYDRWAKSHEMFWVRFWYFVLAATILPALLAAGTMFSAFSRMLWERV